MKTKYAFIGLILLFSVSGEITAQSDYIDILPIKNSKVCYEDVIAVKNVSKEDLFRRAKRWTAVHCEDIKWADNYEIYAKGKIMRDLIYLIIIEIKDERYKYTITEFKISSFSVMNGSSYRTNSSLEEYTIIGKKTYYTNIDKMINKLIISLKESMDTPIEDNW